MYERFYGLRERAFEMTPDPRFLMLTPAHREALGGVGTLELIHSTLYTPGNAAGVRFPHSVAMTAGRVKVRSCILWSDQERGGQFGIFNDSPWTSDVDALAPGDCVGNAFVGQDLDEPVHAGSVEDAKDGRRGRVAQQHLQMALHARVDRPRHRMVSFPTRIRIGRLGAFEQQGE